MHNLPFDTINIDANEVDTLNEVYLAIKTKFDIALTDVIDKELKYFDLFNNVNLNVSVGAAFLISAKASNCYLAFIKRQYKFVGPRDHGGPNYCKYEVWGFITSKKDYGRVLIRRETFTDKILGLVHPVELKFEDDKAFNEKYYVVTNDDEKAALAISRNFRSVMTDINDNDIVIEIINHSLMIRSHVSLNPEDVVYLAELTLKIGACC